MLMTSAVLLLACPGVFAQPGTALMEEGLLVIADAQDSTTVFRWESGPGPKMLSLIWPEGRLTLPADLALQGDSHGNLGVPLRVGFGGTGSDGPFAMVDGTHAFSESLAFTDGRMQWVVSEGTLEIKGSVIRYLRPWGSDSGNDSSPRSPQEQKANFLLIAGLLLLIAVLMRRARQKTRRKT